MIYKAGALKRAGLLHILHIFCVSKHWLASLNLIWVLHLVSSPSLPVLKKELSSAIPRIHSYNTHSVGDGVQSRLRKEEIRDHSSPKRAFLGHLSSFCSICRLPGPRPCLNSIGC